MVGLIVSNLLGLAIGLFTCFFTWWVLFHKIVPRMSFSDYISRLPSPDEPSGYKYRVEFSNIGARNLVDVEVSARLSVRGLQFPKSWAVFSLAFDVQGSKTHAIPIVYNKGGIVVRIFLNAPGGLRESPLLPSGLQTKARHGTLTLEDLLSLGEEARLVVYLFGYDEFSGTRKLFVSNHYHLEAIQDGDFRDIKQRQRSNDVQANSADLRE